MDREHVELTAADVGTLHPQPTAVEHEVLVRSIKRVCRGRPLLAPDDERNEWALINDAQSRGDRDFAERRCRDLVTLLHIPMPALSGSTGIFEAWMLLAGAHAADQGRGCGYDVNDLLLRHPPDGKVHQEACPKCGTVHTFRTARYD